MKNPFFSLVSFLMICFSCTYKGPTEYGSKQPIHEDTPYWQKYSVKYDYQQESGNVYMAAADRNGVINILSDGGL
ncbi:MAG: hypothetical protein JJU28_08120, partial [Cyclobacteriaceae bacterium]|nr:hypothetical protein [Cyclobacteriaceae bacterium]